ncbi:Hypothetical predicted protein, partial [Mytilus galloprovincialis]
EQITIDHYWQFVGAQIIRGDRPTAVKSNLGYLLSGPLKETSIVKAYDNTIKNKLKSKDVSFEELITRDVTEKQNNTYRTTNYSERDYFIEAGQDYGFRQSYSTTPTCTFLVETQESYEEESYTPKRVDYVKSNQHVLTARQCIYCQEIHASVNCTRITNKNERMEFVKRSDFCFNCLGTHRVNECNSRHVCSRFKRNHHTSSSLCNEPMVDEKSTYIQNRASIDQKANRIENDEHEHEHYNESSQLVNVSIVNDKEGKTENDRKVLHTSHKAHSTVLLKTAVAPVWSGRIGKMYHANILFDEGAQRSFITTDLAMKLKLKVVNTETIQLSFFGDTGNTIQHLGKGTLLVETETKQKIPIDGLLPKIAVPLKNHIRKLDLTENKYMYLQGLNLAHPITDESIFEIDVLIGANYN